MIMTHWRKTTTIEPSIAIFIYNSEFQTKGEVLETDLRNYIKSQNLLLHRRFQIIGDSDK